MTKGSRDELNWHIAGSKKQSGRDWIRTGKPTQGENVSNPRRDMLSIRKMYSVLLAAVLVVAHVSAVTTAVTAHVHEFDKLALISTRTALIERDDALSTEHVEVSGAVTSSNTGVQSHFRLALNDPSPLPTPNPSARPTTKPTPNPSARPTPQPSPSPHFSPSRAPTYTPTFTPTPAPSQSAGLTATLKFTYTGSVQQWVVPASVAIFAVDAFGAAGGAGESSNGGLGGYISVGNISASSFIGKTLFIYVGGVGGGGGRAEIYNFTSGGNATDLRTSLGDLSSR